MIAADAPEPNLLKAALWYGRKGYAVFPVVPHGKVPLGSLAPRGVLEATTDAATIGSWWGRVPSANIGIAAGASGLVVIDVDPRNGGDESLALLRARYGADALETCTVITGGGGTHLYYRAPSNAHIPKSSGPLGSGIDIQAENSYVIAPPSVHTSGELYRWEEGYRPTEHMVLTLPADIAKRLTESRPEVASPVQEILRAGERHAPLVSLAGTMRRRGMDADEIFAVLQVTNKKRCEPPLEDKWVRDIAQSMMRYAPKDPIRAMIAPQPVQKPSGLAPIPVGNSYAHARTQPVDLRRYMTGIFELDQVLRGLHPGEMTVIGAQSGVGKSGLAEQIALEVSKTFRVLFIPLEMGIVRTERRLLAKIMKSDEEYIERCERDDATSDQKRDLDAALEKLQDRKMDMLAPNTGDCYTYKQVRALIVERVPDLVIVDHMQHLEDWSGTGKERSDIAAAKIVQNMRKLAELYGIHVMPIHQYKAGPQKRNVRPQLYDFADTAAFSRVADNVIGLHRPMRGTPRDRITELIVLKNRRGPEPWVHCHFVPQCVTLYGMSPEERAQAECCHPKKKKSAKSVDHETHDHETIEMTKAEEDALLNDLPFGPQ